MSLLSNPITCKVRVTCLFTQNYYQIHHVLTWLNPAIPDRTSGGATWQRGTPGTSGRQVASFRNSEFGGWKGQWNITLPFPISRYGDPRCAKALTVDSRGSGFGAVGELCLRAPRIPESRYPDFRRRGNRRRSYCGWLVTPKGSWKSLDSSGPWQKKILVGAACSVRGRLRQDSLHSHWKKTKDLCIGY